MSVPHIYFFLLAQISLLWFCSQFALLMSFYTFCAFYSYRAMLSIFSPLCFPSDFAPPVNPLGLFLGLESPLEASGPLAHSIKMPKWIHWWLMSPCEREVDQGIIVYILKNNLIRPRPSRLVSCFLHGASCHLMSLSVRSFAVTSIILAPSLPPWGLLSRPRVLSLVH